MTSCSQKEPECKIKFHLQNLSIFIIYSAEKHIETDFKIYFTDPKLVSVFFSLTVQISQAGFVNPSRKP